MRGADNIIAKLNKMFRGEHFTLEPDGIDFVSKNYEVQTDSIQNKDGFIETKLSVRDKNQKHMHVNTIIVRENIRTGEFAFEKLFKKNQKEH